MAITPGLPLRAGADRDGNPVLLVGRGQAVRHETLDLASGGSNPPAPATWGPEVSSGSGGIPSAPVWGRIEDRATGGNGGPADEREESHLDPCRIFCGNASRP